MTIPAKPLTSMSVPALRAALVSATAFLLLLAVLILLQPEIDPAWRFVSEHALGRHGWLMSVAFLSLAASGAATGISLWSQVKAAGRIGIGFLAIGALGLTLAGLFTTDPITTPVGTGSTAGQIHALGAILGDGVPVGATLLTLSLLRNQAWRPARGWLLGALAFIWLAYTWLILSMPADGNFGPGVLVGWSSHLLLVSYSIWFMVTVWQSFRLRRQAQG